MKIEGIFGKFYGIAKVTVSKDQPNLMLVCSPFKHVLEWVQEQFGGLYNISILLKEDSEYPYRILAPKSLVGGIVSLVSDTIDYSSFSECAKEKLPPEVLARQKQIEEMLSNMLKQEVSGNTEIPGSDFKN